MTRLTYAVAMFRKAAGRPGAIAAIHITHRGYTLCGRRMRRDQMEVLSRELLPRPRMGLCLQCNHYFERRRRADA